MAITANHVTGALVGVGVAAVGFYLYKKNQDKIENFLRDQGLDIPVSNSKDYSVMNLEELVTAKEKLEDLIAEKELTPAQ